MINCESRAQRKAGGQSGAKKNRNSYKNELEVLRESERRYRTVADFTYDWTYWQSPDGTLLYVSPSCCAGIGLCKKLSV